MNTVGNGREQQQHGRRSGYLYDDLRQVVRDLMAPLYERLDALRDEVHELKRKPAEDMSNRRADVMVIVGVIGVIIALSSCASSVLYIAVSVWLHYAH